MRDYVFDPARLARSPKQLEDDGYAMAARLLRDYLGGCDVSAEVCGREHRAPRLGVTSCPRLRGGVVAIKRRVDEAGRPE